MSSSLASTRIALFLGMSNASHPALVLSISGSNVSAVIGVLYDEVPANSRR
jgi:hypothetical protein